MTIGKGWRLGLLGATLSLSAGCVAEVESDDRSAELGRVQQSINGQVTFGGQCTPAMRTKIRDAMDLIMDDLFSQELTRCMKDAYLFMHEDATPEAIVARLKENMPTHVDCLDYVCNVQDENVAGCAALGVGNESIDLRKSFLTGYSTADVASLMLHEVAHNKGWSHPEQSGHFDYFYTVPEQVRACTQFESPVGLDRSLAAGEAELAPSGGGGGLPFELACGQGSFVRGVRADSSSFVNRVGLDCDNGAQSGTTGEFKDSTRSGTYDCAAGEVVVGVWGTSSHFVDQLGVRCASRAAVAANDVTLDTHDIWVGGGTKGLEFDRTCPTGMAVQRVYGRSGARIDQMRIVCQSVSGATRGTSHNLALAGSDTGTTLRSQCNGFGAMTSLYGGSGGALDRLGGFCRTTSLGGSFPFPDSSSSEHLLEAVGGPGGDEGTKFADKDYAWKDSCASGRALVGLNLRVGSAAGQGLTQVQGICATPTQWSGTGSVARTFTPTRGAGAGALQARECPRGEYLVGLQVWAKKTVHATPTVQGVQPICRRLGL